MTNIGGYIAEERFFRRLGLLYEAGCVIKPDICAEAFVFGFLAIVPVYVVKVVVTPSIGNGSNSAIAMNNGFKKTLFVRPVWVQVAQMPFTEDAGTISVSGKHMRNGSRFSCD